MTLDLPTVSVVTFSSTTIVGLVLCFVWWQERSSPLIGWWGVAQLVMAAGIGFAASASLSNSPSLVAFGQSLMILSAAIMWMAVREFEGRSLNPLLVALWPCGFVIAAAFGVAPDTNDRVILASTLLAVLYFLTAYEFVRDRTEPLTSRWPAILLLALVGAGYLCWMPLALTMPIERVSHVYSSHWFPVVIVIAFLGRVALAFVVLAMVKERQEMRQRLFALTDPLTGLPNRRALFEAVEVVAGEGEGKDDPISVMLFDLDHFKKINDTYGHRFGDRVLQLFSQTLVDELDADCTMGRLGGEEFAAIMPGTRLSVAAAKAESVRVAFAEAASFIDGMPVGGTVSIGVAAHDNIACDIGALFHRADGALYAAKQAGRNRVQVIGPQEGLQHEERELDSVWYGERGPLLPAQRLSRRYRGTGADAA
jgi:diguanylate cyclase (GGDEF)-like protein